VAVMKSCPVVATRSAQSWLPGLGGLAGTWSGDSAEELDAPTVSERSEREVDCGWGDLSETGLDGGIGTAVGAQGTAADTCG
jgi:hypothetical protein